MFVNLEKPQQYASDEYTQHMFLWRNKKIINTVDSRYLDLAYLE